MTDDVLRRLSPRFDAIYAAMGRPSIRVGELQLLGACQRGLCEKTQPSGVAVRAHRGKVGECVEQQQEL